MNLTAGKDLIIGGTGSTVLEADDTLFGRLSAISVGDTYYISGSNTDSVQIGDSFNDAFKLGPWPDAGDLS